ncbi:MAG: hypothetical protein LIO74_02920 [Ruminococcus sp.]|nr:hypothetical protein [Ruminococcus sp.]
MSWSIVTVYPQRASLVTEITVPASMAYTSASMAQARSVPLCVCHVPVVSDFTSSSPLNSLRTR